MSRKLIFPVVLSLALAIAWVTPAFADPPTPPDGLPDGYSYVYSCLTEDHNAAYGAGTHIWWEPVDYIEYLRTHPDDIWFWEYETLGPCKNHAPTEMVLTAGEIYDVTYGECGVHLESAPGGTATLSAIAKDGRQRFSQRPCVLSFINSAAEAVSSFGLSATYFFNLDQAQYEGYLDGTLTFGINDGSGWTACPAMLVGVDLANHDYGRLACSSMQVLQFALLIN